MPNLNEVKEPAFQTGFLERIPQRIDERESMYFLVAVFAILFIASFLLYLTHDETEKAERVPTSLTNLVTQLQNSVEEVTFLANIEALSLPLTLAQIDEFELGPFSSQHFISPSLGCYIRQVENYQLQLLYQSTHWQISWRIDDHGAHYGDAIHELCTDAEHWQLISTSSTS